MRHNVTAAVTTAGARADVASLGHLSNAETHLHVGEVFGGAKTACFVTAGKDLEIVRALRCVIPAATTPSSLTGSLACSDTVLPDSRRLEPSV